MPQVLLPFFLAGTTHLNESLAFECRDGQVTCFNGHLSVFTHALDRLVEHGTEPLPETTRVVNPADAGSAARSGADLPAGPNAPGR